MLVAHRQVVSGPEDSTVEAAEVSEGERRTAPEIHGHVDPAPDGQAAAEPGTLLGTHVQDRAGLHLDRGPRRDRHAVERGREPRAPQCDDRRLDEAQRRTRARELERGRRRRVADDTVDQAMGEIVHRSVGWDTHVPVPDASRVVLDGGRGAAIEDLDQSAGANRRSSRIDIGGLHVGTSTESAATESEGRVSTDMTQAGPGSVTTTSIGVGSKPLQGLLICGQFEITTSTSISARTST